MADTRKMMFRAMLFAQLGLPNQMDFSNPRATMRQLDELDAAGKLGNKPKRPTRTPPKSVDDWLKHNPK